MKLLELTDFLIKNIVKNPDEVSVKEFGGEDNTVIIEVIVSKDDIGVVIGKGGKTANSIRTLVQAASYNLEQKKVIINIDSI